MSKTLILEYYNNFILEGFRKNDEFINRHLEILDMISDKIWTNNKFMNKENNISSPTKLVIERYFCNILAALYLDISDNTIKNILIYTNDKKNIDKYSKLIFDFISKTTNVNIVYMNCEKNKLINIITPEKMRVQIKRGLYDKFYEDKSDLLWIYKYYKSIFELNPFSINKLIDKYKQTNDKYIQWMLIKSIINQGIRKKDEDIVENYLEELKKNNKGRYDYINSYSFYLLVFYGIDKSIEYLNSELDISEFLETSKIDYAESLVFKNYASLLDDNSKIKKELINKCLTNTPNDVDLWKYYMKLYADNNEIEKISKLILKHGYIDIDLIKNITINRNDVLLLIRIIIFCSNKDKKFSRYLNSFIKNKYLNTMLNSLIDIFEVDIIKEV